MLLYIQNKRTTSAVDGRLFKNRVTLKFVKNSLTFNISYLYTKSTI
ncbi:hypothetical protein BMQ_pBM30012 (plasmid) [Priestia megaterium QM B1551]|uniref:Uncharacterized protein n=1 Tax=Priestia megaterium (strain ATCC 12872 / QMB1551) TaxID=545693 RepID=D5E3A4_PRIM1|nr:hypothetical protein BMQ_pBM30012 [Priestia megaterium QM B1551]